MTNQLAEYVRENLEDVVSKLFINAMGKPEKLTSYQARFIKEVITRKHRKAMMVASTRVGKTEACAILSVLLGILYDNEEILILAPTFKQAENLFRRIKDFLFRSEKLIEFIDFSKPFRRDEMNLINHTVIRCLSVGNPSAVLGFGATLLIVDEAEEIPDEVWRTKILRLLTGRAGRQEPVLIMLGTPHTQNFFYESYLDDSVWKMVVTWKEAVKEGIMDEEEVEFARKKMTEAEFDMWYNGKFRSDEDALFPHDKVLALAVGEQETRPVEGFEYVFGVDIARVGNDETAIAVLKIPKEGEFEELEMKVAAIYTRGRCSITESVGFILDKWEKWKPSVVAVDEIGVGGGAVDLLREKIPNVLPLRAMGQTRSEIYSTLLNVIEDGKIILLNDERLVEQLKGYRGKYNSEGRLLIAKDKTRRDDMADALAFAVYAVKMGRGVNVYFDDTIANSSIFKRTEIRRGFLRPL